MRRVYRFGLRGPSEGLGTVRAQLRAAHTYQNQLIEIERARRWALRQLDDTPEVREAIEIVKAWTKSTRKAAVSALRDARKSARATRYARVLLALVAKWDRRVRREARARTSCFWGSYLDIEARHVQARQAPLCSVELRCNAKRRRCRLTKA